ncbi:MAG TPA: hypothetical protein VK359_08540 [Rubrobacteraceae bacterium]|nr:hypothetical protein [Rubrobacteraceae bacterium]
MWPISRRRRAGETNRSSWPSLRMGVRHPRHLVRAPKVLEARENVLPVLA